MTLAWSRHAYAEVVTDQKVATWLGCHRRAFEWFNGVPARLTIDNPKCAITYAIGDDIVATVTFDRTLQLDTANGSPALVLTIGNGTGDATCALATETKKLECTYTVVGDDEDTDGVSIGANPLALNGGRIHGIHGATGGDAELAHAALGSNDRHKVDGVRPTPANASVNGIALTLEWSETLDTGSAPAAGQFVLGVDSGTAPTVSSLTMSGTTMALTLASAADATRDYTLAYTVPSSNPVKDLAGNKNRKYYRAICVDGGVAAWWCGERSVVVVRSITPRGTIGHRRIIAGRRSPVITGRCRSTYRREEYPSRPRPHVRTGIDCNGASLASGSQEREWTKQPNP